MKIYEKRSAAEEFFTEKLGQKPEETYLVQNPRYQCAWRCKLGLINYISLAKDKCEIYGEKHKKAKFRRVKRGDYLLVEGKVCHYKHYTIHCSIGDMCINPKGIIETADCLKAAIPGTQSNLIKILPMKVFNQVGTHELINVIWGIYNEKNKLLEQFSFVQTEEFPSYSPAQHLLKSIQIGDEFELGGKSYHAFLEKGVLTLGKFEQLVDIRAQPNAAGGRR